MGDPDPVFNLKPGLDNVTFWQALDAVAEKAGGRVDLHPREGGLALTKRPRTSWRPPRIVYSGLFRITLNTITSKLDLETDSRSCAASVEVAWEPHLLPLLLETRPSSLRPVVDDAGRVLSGRPCRQLARPGGRPNLAVLRRNLARG